MSLVAFVLYPHSEQPSADVVRASGTILLNTSQPKMEDVQVSLGAFVYPHSE